MVEELKFTRLNRADRGVISSPTAIEEAISGHAEEFLKFVEYNSPLAYDIKTVIYFTALEKLWSSTNRDGILDENLFPITKSQFEKSFGISDSSFTSCLRTLSAAWKTVHQESAENPLEPISGDTSANGKLHQLKGVQYTLLHFLATGRWTPQLLELSDKWGLTPAIEVISTWQTAEQIAELIVRPPEEIYATITVLKDEGVFLPGGIRMRTRQNGTGNNHDQRTFSLTGQAIILEKVGIVGLEKSNTNI